MSDKNASVERKLAEANRVLEQCGKRLPVSQIGRHRAQHQRHEVQRAQNCSGDLLKIQNIVVSAGGNFHRLADQIVCHVQLFQRSFQMLCNSGEMFLR